MQVTASKQWGKRYATRAERVEANLYSARYTDNTIALSLSQSMKGLQPMFKIDLTAEQAEQLGTELIRHATNAKRESTKGDNNG